MIYQFSRFEKASIKRTLMNIAPLKKKQEKLQEKAEAILKELKDVDSKIQAYYQILEPITKGIDPDIILAAENGVVEISEMPEISNDEAVSMDPIEEE